MKDKIDLRVLKTLENINNGFAICIKHKSFSSITVKDITIAAKINRSTFYKYYADKYQLRESMVKSVLEELSKDINFEAFNIENKQKNEALSTLGKQLQFMYERKDCFLTLWNKNMELSVYEDMLRIFEIRTRECIFEITDEMERTEKKLSVKQELFAQLFASSAMTTVKWWFECAPDMSTKAVANIIMDNIKFGMYRAFFNSDEKLHQ